VFAFKNPEKTDIIVSEAEAAYLADYLAAFLAA
jgi:hypothetical protein